MSHLSRCFQLQGHRGARGLLPENTLEGFAGAFAHGVDCIELDIAITADGVPVVVHDPVLHPDLVRGRDGRWLAGPPVRVRDLTRRDLHRYDVGRLRPGSAYASRFAGQRPRDGARIPALADVLALAGPAGVVVDIELKSLADRPELTVSPMAMADAVLRCVAAQPGGRPVVLRSFDWRGLRHVRRGMPDLTLAYLTSRSSVAAAALWWDGVTPAAFGGSVPHAVAAEAGGRPAIWAPEHSSLVRDDLIAAQALGLSVMPWTVNEPADMARLLGWGVNGLCTDYPDRARALRAVRIG